MTKITFKILVVASAVLILSYPAITFAERKVIIVTKEKWITSMNDILPAYFCRDGWYYRSCFNISAEECHLIATDATKSCLLQYSSQIPEELEQPKDGTEWGEKVGNCVGAIIEGSNKDKRISTEKCDNQSEWK